MWQHQQQLMTHVVNTETRRPTPTLATSTLPPFHGKPDENVSTWIFQLENYFATQLTDDNFKVNIAVTLLRDGALQWFHNKSLSNVANDASQTILIWANFVREIKHSFQHPQHQRMIRQQLRTLMQNGSITEYVLHFRTLVGQLEDMSEADRIDHFIAGLRSRTRAEVNYRGPETLENAIHLYNNSVYLYYSLIRSHILGLYIRFLYVVYVIIILIILWYT